ncbi:MAG: hypothetical protein WB495_28320 [Xanthobacteraceae bacterium]
MGAAGYRLRRDALTPAGKRPLSKPEKTSVSPTAIVLVRLIQSFSSELETTANEDLSVLLIYRR